MVYFKLEFGFHLPGRKHRAENKTNSKAQPAWDFISKEVESAEARKCYKTAANYRTAANSLTLFWQRNDWTMADILPQEMERYQRWLIDRGLCMNTISCYMRSLRTLYNRGVALQMTADTQPFRKVFTGKEHTRKRSAQEEDILRLSHLNLENKPSLAFARDIFLFSFYAMGMPFVDIAYLRKEQIRNGRFHYARHKTGQEIVVAIEPCMNEIIRKYEAYSNTPYVFPIINSPDAVLAHGQYQNQLRRYNYNLSCLSKRISASQPLSSYVVRHTWASIAYQHDLDVRLISKALGHTSTSTTMIYMVALETVTNQYLGGDASLACSAETQAQIDRKVVELVKSEHQKALNILTENRAKLDELAKYLYEKEAITGEEFMNILNG